MVLSGFSSAASRRWIMAFGFATAAVSASASAQQAPAAPAQAQAAPAAAPADPLKFGTGSGGIIFYVQPDKAADFESVWATIKSKFAASENPDHKALAEGLHFYKVDLPVSAQGVMYLFIADPAPKTISYNPSPSLLFESKLFPDADARALLMKLSGSLTQQGAAISPLPLIKVQ